VTEGDTFWEAHTWGLLCSLLFMSKGVTRFLMGMRLVHTCELALKGDVDLWRDWLNAFAMAFSSGA
jgi:hypothetical protein